MKKTMMLTLAVMTITSSVARAATTPVSAETAAPASSARTANEFGMATGWLSNDDGLGNRTSYLSWIFRFARELVPNFAIEGALGYYAVENLLNVSDKYKVYPVTVTAKYSYSLGAGFTTFAYAGANKHFVSATGTASDVGSSILNPIRPAFGIGALYDFADGFALRADAGYDVVDLGISLRF